MGLLSRLTGLFKASEAPNPSDGYTHKEEEEVSECCSGGQCTCGVSSIIEEEEASDCCVNGQCTCGESSSTENEDTTVPIMVTNTTTTTATSNISDYVANITLSASGDVNPTPRTEAASITKVSPVVKNEVTMETQVEESSSVVLKGEDSLKEQESLQLEFDLSDKVEEKVPAPVVTPPTLSSARASSSNRTRKRQAKRGKKKKK